MVGDLFGYNRRRHAGGSCVINSRLQIFFASRRSRIIHKFRFSRNNFFVPNRQRITYCIVLCKFQLTDLLHWGVREIGILETEIVALERVKEYTKVPQEVSLRKSSVTIVQKIVRRNRYSN